jgi:hypothetical protein
MKTQIPLNSFLLEGDFKPPFETGGRGSSVRQRFCGSDGKLKMRNGKAGI